MPGFAGILSLFSKVGAGLRTATVPLVAARRSAPTFQFPLDGSAPFNALTLLSKHDDPFRQGWSVPASHPQYPLVSACRLSYRQRKPQPVGRLSVFLATSQAATIARMKNGSRSKHNK